MTALIIFVVFIIIFGFGRKAARSAKVDPSNPSPRVQKLLERMQAQQAGNQPPGVQGTGRAQSSAQLAGMLQALLSAGQQGQHPNPGQHTPAQGQYGGPPVQAGYAPPGQFQPVQQYPAPQPTNWPPQYQQAPQAPQYAPQANRTQHGRQPEHNFPAPNSPLEKRIRDLMSTGHEVPAIRLLCDEQDLGIIEAQKYARGLIAPAGRAGSTTDPDSPRSESTEDETRYIGSAAFAESPFDLDRDENVWASGWVEKPEPEDRTDIDELWQTVRNAGRPATPPS